MLMKFVHRISFNLPDRDNPRVGLATPRLSSTHREWGSLVIFRQCAEIGLISAMTIVTELRRLGRRFACPALAPPIQLLPYRTPLEGDCCLNVALLFAML